MQDGHTHWSGDHNYPEDFRREGSTSFSHIVSPRKERKSFPIPLRAFFRDFKPCQSHLTPPLIFNLPETIEAT